MTYALLIYRIRETQMSKADEQRALEAHRAMQRSAGKELRAVARLDDVPTAKTIRFRGGEHAVTDGPYMEAKEWLVGFYLVDCASEALALERARQICPHDGHCIEVRPVTWSKV